MYVDYVCRKFNQPAIVFDGYEAGPSTKDITHHQRSGGVVGAQVNFDGSMPNMSKKDHFLANNTNKHSFVTMLSQKLQTLGCKAVHAECNADIPIAQKR